MSVDLTKKPYYLKDEDIQWVNSTIANMTLEEKIGQLFVNMGSSRTEEYLTDILNRYHIGAVRYNPGPAEEVYNQNYILQTKSKIPLLIAANTEAGGNGACSDGTEIGLQVKIGATGDAKYAYEMGRVAGIEAAAIGCNWSFAPIVDISYNWRNPIISNRVFGSNPDKVLEMSLAYMKGIQESGIAPTAKHFPGDGVDERDQHLSFSVNSFSCEEWDNSFGKVYQGLIDAGLPSIMAGHIHLPAYEQHFNPNLSYEDCLPATLSKPILTDLLRGKLGFNGVVVTDASHMVAMTSAMKRSEMLPKAIAAGCDLFLFFNDPDEDFDYMMAGYKNGIITEERLNDALTRILGLKAKLGLHNRPKETLLEPKEQALAKIGLPEHKVIFRDVADKAITLVKNKQDILPINVERFPRVLLVNVKGTDGGFGKMVAGSQRSATEILKEKLAEKGFTVSIYTSPMDNILKMSDEEQVNTIRNEYSQKRPITTLTDHYDLIINVANVQMSTVQRIVWQATKGTPDIPFYVHEVPTIFVSVQCPFHLVDVPQVKTYINAYDGKEPTIELLVEKLMGNSEFKGVSPVDAFCGYKDTHI
ncbi:TPA: beta-hexosaminidase [Mannheimia haemolytica]|uniref:beta-N-acetylhexosaminidase n=3 Tax=Mannheimia haemolytica TaxID=75985 RepID=A0A378NDN3_MANHA|nr:glycoside hydrolase family 3 N-terminal domain-containing protein [Mannheimia haemolytica]EEY11651.1 putative beta-hexosamidase A, glycoside hydrolase family 3 [Mannheimia haemolytica serotype A2 str. BOVINE]KYL17991.1 beta-hexosaminidase [Mannheimia haemolytica]MDW0723635.1 glycoside hydrolase family 3 N-terminal domain-containing protein [Mannheimia haemolytica]MDW1157658.1 glycoside hydrolase family 3 N-terminal domain-containing protein [Mannheimia haemolytica]TCS87174.1 beta-N-acetylhe